MTIWLNMTEYDQYDSIWLSIYLSTYLPMIVVI